MEDLDGALGSGVLLSPVLTTVALQVVNQWMEDYLSIYISPSQQLFQINLKNASFLKN